MPDARIVIGDARLTIAAETDPPLDLLVIDAFSSDAVPMHLLTREALETYRRRLKPGGLLVVHISNRFMRLEPVLADAQNHGWAVRARKYEVEAEGIAKSHSSSLWVALARDPAVLDRLAAASGKDRWKPLERDPKFTGWTDDFASILPLLKWTGH